jgi:hypothetical protein
MDSNISEAVPLRQDLLKSLRRTAWIGWSVAAILFIVVLVLVGVLVLRPTPLMGVDENGNVVGQVVFDEPRLRSSAQILSDMKGLARRCMTVSKISVWDDMEVCLNHVSDDIRNVMLETYEATGYLTRIEEYGCERVDFAFNDTNTGLTVHNRSDYYVEGVFEANVTCMDMGGNTPENMKLSLKAVLVPKTTLNPLGIKVIEYAD